MSAADEDNVVCDNLIGGEVLAPSSGSYLDICSPAEGRVVGKVALSTEEDVSKAVEAASLALVSWSALTVKARAAIMFRFQQLIEKNADELADLVVLENGKNKAEALASVAKANETVEWSCSLPNQYKGSCLQVSRGIDCRDVREPLGVVACIVPFNFPIMVPMWTCPIALTAGNCVILKPSEKVPMTMRRVSELLIEAGIPPGVFQIVNGTKTVVEALCDHPSVEAVSFVGSSKVAEIVAQRCSKGGKRCLALGGAKNHLVALPDCNHEEAAKDIVASFCGCAGQRCMAASVLILVGDTGDLLERVLSAAKGLKAGTQAGDVGAVIDADSQRRILGFIQDAKSDKDVEVLLDGSSWSTRSPGTWVGPTVLLHATREGRALHEEIFGPVLSVLRVGNWQEALAIERANPYGNAASIYTSVGAHADYFASRFRAGMIGVNIGVPVPREPFSFGGHSSTLSKYGDMDITGEGALDLFTHRRKITTKWPSVRLAASDASSTGQGAGLTPCDDVGSFVGTM